MPVVLRMEQLSKRRFDIDKPGELYRAVCEYTGDEALAGKMRLDLIIETKKNEYNSLQSDQ